jgi:hypothetical protein
MTVGGIGLGIYSAVPCPGNRGGNKKIEGTHCLVILQVLRFLGSLLLSFHLPDSFHACLLFYSQEFFSYKE